MSAVYLDATWSSDGLRCWVELPGGGTASGSGPSSADARRDLAHQLSMVSELAGSSVIVRSHPIEGSSQTVVLPDGRLADLPDPPRPEAPGAAPEGQGALLVRVAFTDERSWQELMQDLRRPSPEGFAASVTPVERAEFAGASPDSVVRELGLEDSPVVFLADAPGMSDAPRSVLAVCARSGQVRSFRVAAEWVWAVETNLALSNMDWEEFAVVAGDGTFQGFPEH